MKLGEPSIGASLRILSGQIQQLQNSYYQLYRVLQPTSLCDLCGKVESEFRAKTSHAVLLSSCKQCLEDLHQAEVVASFTPIYPTA